MADYNVVVHLGKNNKEVKGKLVNVVDLKDVMVFRVNNMQQSRELKEKLMKLRNGKAFLILPKDCDVCHLEEMKKEA